MLQPECSTNVAGVKQARVFYFRLNYRQAGMKNTTKLSSFEPAYENITFVEVSCISGF